MVVELPEVSYEVELSTYWDMSIVFPAFSVHFLLGYIPNSDIYHLLSAQPKAQTLLKCSKMSKQAVKRGKKSKQEVHHSNKYHLSYK